MRLMKLLALVGLFFLSVVAASALAAEPQVSINTMTPGQWRVASLGHSANAALVVRVVKHPRNQELLISCDGMNGGNYSVTKKSFDEGEKHQQKIFDVFFNLSSATYYCEAVLKRKQEDGKIKEFTSFVEVTVY